MSKLITKLVLPIKRKWFDMIMYGEKKEEYREIKPYWTKRFQTIGLLDKNGEMTRKIVRVTFRNGYGKDAPEFKAWVDMAIGNGLQNWGAEPGKTYYILVINQVCYDALSEETV